MFIVYAIESITGRVYIGQSGDFDKRLLLHNSGRVKSTSKDGHWHLIAMEEYETRDAARWCETALKKSRGRRLKWLEEHRI